MIAKAAQVAFFRRINKFALVKGHEIKMLNPFSIVLSHAPSEVAFIDHLADVLENKLVRSQVGLGTETVPLLFGFDDGYIGVLFSLKSLILTFRATATVAHTLDLGRAVDTIRILTTCQIFANRGI